MVLERHSNYIKVKIENSDDILDVFLFVKDSYRIEALQSEIYEYKGTRFSVGDTLIVERNKIYHAVQDN